VTQPGEPSPKPNPQKKTARFQPRPFGKYQLLREIGHGGKGVVYEALDGVLSRKVALKMILPQPDIDPAELKREEDRFLVEARLSANLPKHPHIVSVYEAGDVDGRRYLAAELVIGQPMIRWRRAATPKQQLEVLRDVALAMEHSHKHGIVHRDLKPQNILIDGEGQPHVTDFGLAKMIGQKEDIAAVAPGLILGTPTYMSPEHARGLPNVDQRTDLYSLGVMLHEIVTGRAPFQGESSTEIMDKVVNAPLPPPELLAGLPSSLKATCQKALSKNPAQRHASARAFADEVTSALLEMGGGVTGGVPVAEAPKKKPVVLLAGIGAAALLAVVVVLVLLLSGGPDLKKVAAALELADRRMQEGRYADAREAYEQAIREDAENQRAQQGRSLAQKRQAEQQESEKRRAVETAAEDARRQEAEKSKAQQDDLKKQLEARSRADEEQQAFLKAQQIKAEEEKRMAEERLKAAEAALKAREDATKPPTPAPTPAPVTKPGPPNPAPPTPGAKPGVRPDTAPTVAPTGVAKVLEDGSLHVEAEDYTGGDLPVEGEDYHDTTPGNNGRRYRANDVDIGQINEQEGGGFFVGDPTPGEWLRYRFEGGGARYQVEVRFYSRDAAKIHLEVDGADVTGPIDLPDAGGKKNQSLWTTTVAYTRKFPEGAHALRLVFDAGGRVGVDWLRLKKLAPKPAPEAAAAAEAQKAVKEAFKADYAKKGPADLAFLAKKLIDEARKLENDPAGQFAMLSEARDIAAQGGDLAASLEAIEELERGYVVDAFAMKVAAAGTASKYAKTPAAWKDVTEAYLALAEDAAEREDYEQAIVLAGKSEAAAKSGHDTAAAATAQGRVKELTAVRDEFRSIQASLKALETKADDPAANLAVGLYRCFARREWPKGLALIAKGSDPALALLAKRELEAADDPVEQAALGDGWREAAGKKSTGLLRTRFETRALMWYEKALPGLTGVPKLKAEGHVETLAKSVYGTDSLKKGLVFWVEPSRDYAEGYREFVSGGRATSNGVAISNEGGVRVISCNRGWVEYPASEPVKVMSKGGSVFAWIKSGNYGRAAGIVDRGDPQKDDFGLWTNNGRVGAWFNWPESTQRGLQLGKTPLPVDKWIHVGFTWDEKEITFYVEGREDSAVPLLPPGVPIRRGTRVYVGANVPGGADDFQGFIGSVVIYNRTLSAQEVQQLHLGTRARFR
jgi:hypothetical protein